MPAYTTEGKDGGTGRRQVMATVVFTVLAFVVAYLPGPQQQQVAAVLRGSVLRPFLFTQAGLADSRIRAEDSESLRASLDSAVARVTNGTTLAEENRQLRGLLSISRRVGTSYHPAAVIRSGTAGSESMFILDVGREEGVYLDAPVITRHGLVGVVREVREHTSLGMDWTHPEFRASAMILDGSTYGIVESRRGDFREEDRLVLNGTAFNARLEEGAVVVTSGLGGVLPRGIPVGRVQSLADAEAGWRKSYWLEPYVQVGAVTHVLVASDSSAALADLSAAWPEDSVMTDAEMRAAERARADSVSALGDSTAMLRRILRRASTEDSLALVRLAAPDTASPVRRAPAPPPRPAPASGGGGNAAPAGPPARDTTGGGRPDTLGVGLPGGAAGRPGEGGRR